MCAMIGSSHFLALRTNSSCRQASKQFGDQEVMTKETGPDKVPLVGIPFMLVRVLVGIY